MRKIVFFVIGLSIFFISCDKGCTDYTACNYGIITEDCKYADEQEALLTGSWNLVDIHDENGTCVFSASSNYDCELDDILSWINIGFNYDKTCILVASPSDLSDPIPIGEWSINVCDNILNFSNNNSGYDPYLYPDYLPFGNQIIIELSSDVFMCEDLAGHILRWEKI